jgi:hypothetical protein
MNIWNNWNRKGRLIMENKEKDFIIEVLEAVKIDLGKRDIMAAYGRLSVLLDKLKEEEK